MQLDHARPAATGGSGSQATAVTPRQTTGPEARRVAIDSKSSQSSPLGQADHVAAGDDQVVDGLNVHQVQRVPDADRNSRDEGHRRGDESFAAETAVD